MRKYKFEVDGLTKAERYRQKDIPAYREMKRKYAATPEQREVRAAYMRKWREANREKFNEQARKSHHKNKHKHKDYHRNYDLMKKMGITLEQKLEMVKRQNGKCAICGEDFKSSRSTHADHYHKTMKVRGILCHMCNTKLGWLEAHLSGVKAYLGTNW